MAIRISAMPSLRQHLGALVHDWPRFVRHVRGDWPRIRNRAEPITRDGRGVRCDWVFSRDLYITQQYPSAARELMHRAFGQWPITLREEPVLTANPEVSFIIGHRGMARLPNLLATLRSIAGQRDVAVECIVVEQSAEREVEGLLPSWVRYVHTPVGPGVDYCRSATFNVGVEVSRGAVLIAHDNDMLVPERWALEVMARAREGWQFIDLKRFIFYLSEEDSAEIFRGQMPMNGTSIVVENLKGGSVAATPDAYRAIGGFDEDFVGWGGEDLEFWERARAHGGVYEFGYLPLIHLWHAPQPGKVNQAAAPAMLRYDEVSRMAPEERIALLRSRNFSNVK